VTAGIILEIFFTRDPAEQDYNSTLLDSTQVFSELHSYFPR
jgi:hypothetical protein